MRSRSPFKLHRNDPHSLADRATLLPKHPRSLPHPQKTTPSKTGRHLRSRYRDEKESGLEAVPAELPHRHRDLDQERVEGCLHYRLRPRRGEEVEVRAVYLL